MDGTARRCFPPKSHACHLADTLRLAAPLAIAQLAQMAMGVTDTVLLGGIDGAALAAGGLGGSLLMTTLIVLQGVLTAVSVLVAQARGAGRDGEVPALYWTGMVLTALLLLPALALSGNVAPLLLLVGEPPELVRDVQDYVSVLRWAIPGGLLGMGLMRAFLPAVGRGGLILWVTLAEAAANGAVSCGLIHGAWGLPALGLRGAALATVIVWSAGALALLVALHRGTESRRWVCLAAPRRALLLRMLRLGLPVAATFAVETGLFLAIALMIGLLGPAALAAQQVALNTLGIAFMVPLGIAQAANVLVGNHVGAGDRAGARRAGLVAIALGAAFEVAAALAVLCLPGPIAALYLDRGDAATAIAVVLLQVGTIFQVADGVRCVASGALRGLGDTAVPFRLAAFGYWGIGFPAAWLLTVRGGVGAVGAWWGLAAALGVVAVLLTGRFLAHTRPAA